MNELQTRWLEALRSNKYRQLFSGHLKDGPRYSPLGVLCNIFDDNAWGYTDLWYLGRTPYLSMPPKQLLDKVNLEVEEAITISHMNDEYGLSFVQIAQELEFIWQTKGNDYEDSI